MGGGILTGCSDGESEPQPALSLALEPSEPILFEASGGTAAVRVVTDAESWTVDSDAPWCAVEPSGSGFTVTVGSNESLQPRGEAAVTVTASSPGMSAPASAVLKVGQKGLEIFGTDLSAGESANCYIVPAAGGYSFDATAAGCGQKGIIGGAGFHSASAVVEPRGVRLLWQDCFENGEGLVSSLELTAGRVCFTATGRRGNAVVAVTDDRDEIIWSWHLWFVDYGPDMDKTVVGHEGGRSVVMDLNLGSVPDGAHTYGLYYQWGRKDPFIGLTADLSDILATYDIQGKPVVWQDNGSEDGESIEWSVRNPTGFIRANRSTPGVYYNWTPEQNDYLWGDPDASSDGSGRIKTVYDPCPPGYIVPHRNAFTGFTSTGIINDRFEELRVKGDWDTGWNFLCDDTETSFFPAAGYWVDFIGMPASVASAGCYWTSAPDARDRGSASSLFFHFATVNPASWDSRANGFSVRCMRL